MKGAVLATSRAVLAGVGWLCVATAVLAAEVPFLSGRVVDNAEVLPAKSRDGLTALLKAHEDRTTNQVVVLTVPTIGGESIEEYASRVFAAWKLGQKGKDNGVLVAGGSERSQDAHRGRLWARGHADRRAGEPHHPQ